MALWKSFVKPTVTFKLETKLALSMVQYIFPYFLWSFFLGFPLFPLVLKISGRACFFPKCATFTQKIVFKAIMFPRKASFSKLLIKNGVN